MALEAVDEVELGHGRLFLALISQPAQCRDRPRKVAIANENAWVPEHAETEVTVGLKREDRTLERNCLNTVVGQCFDRSPKVNEQRAVSLSCLIRIRAEGISYFLGHQVGRNTITRFKLRPARPASPWSTAVRAKRVQSMPSLSISRIAAVPSSLATTLAQANKSPNPSVIDYFASSYHCWDKFQAGRLLLLVGADGPLCPNDNTAGHCFILRGKRMK